MTAFVTAVQEQDWTTLFCLLVEGTEEDRRPELERARREAFARWAQGETARYLEQRDRGFVALTPDGIALAKLFVLGKGTYYEMSAVRREARQWVADLTVRFGYDAMDLSGFPPGTVIYFAAAPPGRVARLEVPEGEASRSVEVLQEIVLRWTLERRAATASCPEGWRVVAVEPLPETAVTQKLTWVFQ